MTARLTHRQQQILDFITDSIETRGMPPTLREIGHRFGISSTNGVNDHLKALEKKGRLRREGLKSRALCPVPIDDECEVPILGRVAAGRPMLAVENVDDTVRVGRFFLGGHRDVFGLRVIGDSMIDAGIHDGDVVFVRKAESARSGDIVVAMLEDEVTVKRYSQERNHVRLEPANASMKPIIVTRAEFRAIGLCGVVIGVFRRLS